MKGRISPQLAYQRRKTDKEVKELLKTKTTAIQWEEIVAIHNKYNVKVISYESK